MHDVNTYTLTHSNVQITHVNTLQACMQACQPVFRIWVTCVHASQPVFIQRKSRQYFVAIIIQNANWNRLKSVPL